ncbi:MAG TPA: hypothetical protein ENF55_04035 [Thermoprotei archaeon]|nr:hypothetical protein [Thermoprotei archaeon]
MKSVKLEKKLFFEAGIPDEDVEVFLCEGSRLGVFSVDEFSRKIIAVSRFLVDSLSRDELRALIVRELRIKNRDFVFLTSFMLTPLLLLSLGVYFLTRGFGVSF